MLKVETKPRLANPAAQSMVNFAQEKMDGHLCSGRDGGPSLASICGPTKEDTLELTTHREASQQVDSLLRQAINNDREAWICETRPAAPTPDDLHRLGYPGLASRKPLRRAGKPFR
jgi:hypothetical protein